VPALPAPAPPVPAPSRLPLEQAIDVSASSTPKPQPILRRERMFHAGASSVPGQDLTDLAGPALRDRIEMSRFA
jgi:hypothetical protein